MSMKLFQGWECATPIASGVSVGSTFEAKFLNFEERRADHSEIIADICTTGG